MKFYFIISVLIYALVIQCVGVKQYLRSKSVCKLKLCCELTVFYMGIMQFQQCRQWLGGWPLYAVQELNLCWKRALLNMFYKFHCFSYFYYTYICALKCPVENYNEWNRYTKIHLFCICRPISLKCIVTIGGWE